MDISQNIPSWAKDSEFFSITKTPDELSVVCVQDQIPAAVQCERYWRIIQVEGPLDFNLTGILAAISAILADEKISIFAVSTYDTDYILVRQRDLRIALEALSLKGYVIAV